MNHKQALRLMREDNLLALWRKTFVPTIDPNHDRAVYTNLLPALNVTGVNQGKAMWTPSKRPGIRISMSRRENTYDNAKKSLFLRECMNRSKTRSCIDDIIDSSTIVNAYTRSTDLLPCSNERAG